MAGIVPRRPSVSRTSANASAEAPPHPIGAGCSTRAGHDQMCDDPRK
jgi:hypothetical protein